MLSFAIPRPHVFLTNENVNAQRKGAEGDHGRTDTEAGEWGMLDVHASNISEKIPQKSPLTVVTTAGGRGS